MPGSNSEPLPAQLAESLHDEEKRPRSRFSDIFTREKLLPSTAPSIDIPNPSPPQTPHATPLEAALTAPREPKTKPLSLAVLTFAVCLVTFMVGLDNTIIATAIPQITDEFRSLTDVGWYASSYLLTTCAFQLFFGKLYSMTPVKWTFVGAIVIFELGSLICGVAPNSVALIVGRSVAGVGASGMYSGAMLCVAHSVPLRTRSAYIGGVASMWGVASVAGPLLGGAFTDHLTWRWCFYINLPLGAVALFIVIFLWNPPKIGYQRLPFLQFLAKLDLIGTCLFVPGVVCALVALQWGGTTYPWSDWRIIVLLVFFGLLMIAFVALQIHLKEDATIPLHILSRRAIWSATIYSALIGGSFFAVVYFVSIWFQAVKGMSAVQSGIDSIPLVLATIVVSGIAGVLTAVFGYYTHYFHLGSICAAIGAGLMIAYFKPDTPSPVWIGLQVLFGGGPGFGLQQSIIAVQAHSALAEVPISVSLVLFALNFGGSIFVSVAQALFTNQIVDKITAMFPGVSASTLLSSGATNLADALRNVPEEVRDQVIGAYNDALTHGPFLLAAALAAAAIFPAMFQPWTSVKGRAIDLVAA